MASDAGLDDTHAAHAADSTCIVTKRTLMNGKQAPIDDLPACCQLVSCCFPAASPTRSPIARRSPAQSPHQHSPTSMVLRSASRKGCRLRHCTESDDAELTNPDTSPPGSATRRRAQPASSHRALAAAAVEEADTQASDVGGMSEADVAWTLLSMASTGQWQQQQKQQQQQPVKPEAHTLQDSPPRAALTLQHLVAAAHTAAADLLATSPHRPAALAAACQRLSEQCCAQQAVLDAAVAGLLGLRADAAGAAAAVAAAGATTPGSAAPTESEAQTAPLSSCGGGSSRGAPDGPLSPFASHARRSLSHLFKQQQQSLQRTSTAAANDAAGADETAAFASSWTQQLSAQLPPVKAQQPAQACVQCAFPPSPPGATCTPVSAACSSPQRPFQQQQYLAISPQAAGMLGSPTSGSPGSFLQKDSVFARECATKITEAIKEALRASWQATGRMAVACDVAGKKGARLLGVFVVNAAGKPAIWVPQSSAAAGRVSAVVAEAGGGGSQVPPGFEEMPPNEFEDKAGKSRTHNWQLSIYLTDFHMLPTPKCPAPNVRLGHLVRIVGIPTSGSSK